MRSYKKRSFLLLELMLCLFLVALLSVPLLSQHYQILKQYRKVHRNFSLENQADQQIFNFLQGFLQRKTLLSELPSLSSNKWRGNVWKHARLWKEGDLKCEALVEDPRKEAKGTKLSRFLHLRVSSEEDFFQKELKFYVKKKKS